MYVPLTAPLAGRSPSASVVAQNGTNGVGVGEGEAVGLGDAGGEGVGVAVGGGCTITVACDIVYVGESLRMRLPFANLGLVPEIASSYTLQAAIGRQRAAELMFTAEWIDAARALETGIATSVHADAELLDVALGKAREIAKHPVSSLQATKRTLLAARQAGVDAAFQAEDAGMKAQAGSPENLEAVRAFIEKRPPDFAQFRKRS